MRILLKGKNYRVHHSGKVEVQYIKPDEYGGLKYWRTLPQGKRSAEVRKIAAEFNSLVAKE